MEAETRAGRAGQAPSQEESKDAETRPTRLPQTSAGTGENNVQGAEGKECKLERKKQLHARKTTMGY